MKPAEHVQRQIDDGIISERHWVLYNAAFDALASGARVTLHTRFANFEVEAVGLDVSADGLIFSVARGGSEVIIDWSTLYAVTTTKPSSHARVEAF